MFENVGEMMEWLILVESKLQPRPLVVGDTTKLRTLLDEILVSSFLPHEL